MPTPTWGNHGAIFKDSGLTCQNYRYWDAKTNGLDLAGMMEDIKVCCFSLFLCVAVYNYVCLSLSLRVIAGHSFID